MEGQLEWQRRAHEEIDRLEAAMVDLILANPNAGSEDVPSQSRVFKQKLLVEHQLATLLAQMHSTAKALKPSYSAENSARSEEVSRLLLPTPNDLAPFYSRLRAVKELHRELPLNAPAVDTIELEGVLSSAKVSAANMSVMFSGEERNGRFLDLHRHYDAFVNLLDRPAASDFDYLKYLDFVFETPRDLLPEGIEGKAAYLNYLTDLLGYLEDFLHRTRPLNDLDGSFTQLQVKPAADETEQSSLFCGACQHTFTNKNVYENHLTGKKHIKALERNEAQPSQPPRQAKPSRKDEVLAKESTLKRIGELLDAVRRATRGWVEARQAMTPEERAKVDEDEEAETNTAADVRVDAPEGEQPEEDADPSALDGRIYNPLKLPLDWDGKPIPYWLWKLHGLGVSYSCEICGNFVYMGRRAFDQHFFEWRHAHGMRCLGIPNTKHFFQVTQIDEVKSLWERLRATAKDELFKPEVMEECEDAYGNVYDRKTYEDLKRQGLI